MDIRKKNTDFKFSEGFIQDALNGFFVYNSVKYNIDGLYIYLIGSQINYLKPNQDISMSLK